MNRNKTITIERTLEAPIELVWEAWTEAEHIVNWWGPEGMETKIIQHDFSEGGNWKYVMNMPNGGEFIAEGKYIEIQAPVRLVTTANFLPMTEGVTLEVILKGEGQKTLFTFNVIHKSEAYKIQQEKMGIYHGWGSVFDRLEKLLITLIH